MNEKHEKELLKAFTLFDDDDAIKSFLYEVVEHIDQNDNCIYFWINFH